jgi:hypothetical protein
MHTKMDFSDKTKEIIDSIVQETLRPIMAQEKQDSEETKMSEAVKQWIDDKQGKFNGKEI